MARVQNKKQIKRDDQFDKDNKNNLESHKSKPTLEFKSGAFIAPVKKRNNLAFTGNLREEYHSILLPLEQYVPFRFKWNDEQQLLMHEHVQK